MTDYEVVIGLEVHVELATKSKLFCSCGTNFDAEPNDNVCPGCAGMPGTLPVLNRKVAELAILAGIVTNCQINEFSTFDKKNYFYPDLSCSYQITQFFAPVCTQGKVEIEVDGEIRTIGIKQIHIEEDAGKLKHDAYNSSTLVDFNRCSIPLLEIVSLPDFREAAEVVKYLEKLQSYLRFVGVSDCKMQEGSMRCDVNLSVRKRGETRLGTRTEMKNMNSLKAITRAIAYETQRHIDHIENGTQDKLIQETRRWDDAAGKSYAMRAKENAQDYRYFPNPDLSPLHISKEWIESVKQSMPELPGAKLSRYMQEYGLPEYDSKLITSSKKLCDIFEYCVTKCHKPKEVSNWIIGDLMSLANTAGLAYDDIELDAERLSRLITLVSERGITRNTAKKVLSEVFENAADPDEYIAAHGLGMVSDSGELESIVKSVVENNPGSASDYRAGKTQALGFLVGRVMRETKGKADPALVNELLLGLLNQ